LSQLRHRLWPLLEHPRPLPDGQPDPRPIVDRRRKDLPRFLKVAAGIKKRQVLRGFSSLLYCHALALYFFWYNWVRIHKTLGVTPAMAAGLSDKLLSMSDLAEMIDEALPKPGKRGPYKKRLVA
jgi:hypothetical protein